MKIGSSSSRLVARNSRYAIYSSLFSAASLLVTYKLAADSIGISAIGMWSIALSLTSLAGVADMGLPLAMVREVARLASVADWRGVTRLVLSAGLVSAGATMVLVYLSVPIVHWVLDRFVLKGTGQVPDGLLIACALTVSLTSVSLLFTGVLKGLERYDLKFWSMLFGNSAMVTAVVLFGRAEHPPSIAWAFVVLYGCTAMASGFAVCRSLNEKRRGHDGVSGERRRTLLGNAIRIGAPLRMAGLASLFFEPITRFYFGALGGLHSAGIYEVASRICMQVQSLISSAVQVIVPRLMMLRATDQAENLALLRAGFRLTAISAMLGLAGLLLGITSASTLLLAGIDRDFAFLVATLGAAWMFHVLASPAYFANIADGTVHWNWISQWSAVVVSAVVGPLAWLLFGSWQAIVAGPFAGLVSATLVALVSLNRRRREGLLQVSFRDFRIIVVVALILGGCQLGGELLLEGSWSLLTGILTLAVYSAFALRFLSGAVARHAPASA